MGDLSDEQTRELIEVARYHTCFDCHRQLEYHDIITLTFVGPLPIYHHTACVFTEEETEDIKWKALEGEIVRKAKE